MRSTPRSPRLRPVCLTWAGKPPRDSTQVRISSWLVVVVLAGRFVDFLVAESPGLRVAEMALRGGAFFEEAFFLDAAFFVGAFFVEAFFVAAFFDEAFFAELAAFLLGDWETRRLGDLRDREAVERATSLLNRFRFSSDNSIDSLLRSNHSKNSSHPISSSVSSPL